MKNALFAEIRRAMNLLWIPAVLGVGFSICFDSWNDFLRSLSTGIGSVQYFFEIPPLEAPAEVIFSRSLRRFPLLPASAGNTGIKPSLLSYIGKGEKTTVW